MKNKATKSLAVAATLSFATPVLAMPDNPIEMRQIISTQFGDNVAAYFEENRNDFRCIGCRGRTDLLQFLLDDGLVINDISYEIHWRAFECAVNNE